MAVFGLLACGGEAPSTSATGESAHSANPGGSGMMGTSAAPAAGTTGQAGAESAAQSGSGKPPATRAAASTDSGATGGAGAGAAGEGTQAGSPGSTMTGGAGADAPNGSAGSAAGSGEAGAPADEPCPASSALAAGDHREMLMHGGRARRFNVYVPSSIDAQTRVPLVLDFHGNGSSGAQEQSGSGWRQKADTEQFIVVYPDGVGNGWNVGNCCGEALSSMVDDVGFARALVEHVSGAACIDRHRVYATGISNGAGLAHRLACEAADVFAAIAAASADLVTDPCTPARPISELSIRGLNDTLVAYEGGNTGSTGWYSPGAKGTLELWKDINGCTGDPSTTLEHCETYTQCRAGVEVTLCSLPSTGHILYTNSLGFSVADNAWDMFKRQTLP